MDALNKITRFRADLQRACRHYHGAYPAALLRALYLYSVGQFSRKEIIGYGLFVPSICARMPILISKEQSLAKLARFNPPNSQHLTESKDEFYAICRQNRLPIPETYGWTRNGRAYDANGTVLEGDQAWREYLSGRLPQDFVIKDRAGAYGSGFAAFHRTGNSFKSVATDDLYDIRGLLRAFSLAGGSEGIIIQERLFDTALLSTLSGRRGLQTVRINTLLLPDGRVSILFYWFKILAGHMLSDNFSMGTSGNLAAFGDPDVGILRGAVRLHECGSGMQLVTVHPETGISLDGFKLPFWPEAIDLVTTGQRCFPALPTLGWDIAFAETGPVIIEANSRWDPPLFVPFVMSEENWRRIFGGPSSTLQ
jgi:hypothetical protein